MQRFFQGLFYSFSVQLLILHLRSNLLLLTLWGILVMFVSGGLGYKLGFQYLFLDPEYLGSVNFWSFLFVGLSFGGFFMTWNLTTYLLTAHNFPFLASLSRPFTKFCINNLILPGAFFVFYLIQVIHFERAFEEWSWPGILANSLGFIVGALAVIMLFALYFQFTNRDISFFEESEEENQAAKNTIAPGRPNIDLDFIKMDANRLPVQTYLNQRFRRRLVRSVAHYPSELLLSIFRQNHLNALVIQLISLIGLMFLGWLIDYPVFRIPAASSILILFSVVAALIGAITYWFHAWRSTIIILLLVLINFTTSFRQLGHVNRAYGLDYQQEPAPYSLSSLDTICRSDQIELDKAHTIQILEKWKQRVSEKGKKPKLVLIAVSGGGLRSVTWTLHVMQTADKSLDGKLIKHTGLITGASGGIIGMSYYRELWLRENLLEPVNRLDPGHLDQITRDLLNPIAFTLTTNDLFLPWGRFKINGNTYRKDRGYVFERVLNENTSFLMDKRLADYREPEFKAEIPMLFITPSIVNDARRLVISPQPVSYMMVAPRQEEEGIPMYVDAVDFGRLFKKQDADQLRFLTALRMNATYPYVLPTVHLPTDPGIEVMDAGFRDNFGLLSATRFIQVFKDWILEHTSGVVLVQINSSVQTIEIEASDRQGFVESLINPLGIAAQILDVQEYEQNNSIGFIYDLLGPDYFHYVNFRYAPPPESKLKPSISFHITKREKDLVLEALQQEANQSSMRRLVELLK